MIGEGCDLTIYPLLKRKGKKEKKVEMLLKNFEMGLLLLVIATQVGEVGVEGRGMGAAALRFRSVEGTPWCPSGCVCRDPTRWNCRRGVLVPSEWSNIRLPEYLDLSGAVGLDLTTLGCWQWQEVKFLSLLRSRTTCDVIEQCLHECGVEV